MKKDRNCGMAPGMMPGNPGAVPYAGVMAYGPNQGFGQMAVPGPAPMAPGMMAGGPGFMPAPGMVSPVMPGANMNPVMENVTVTGCPGAAGNQTTASLEQMQAQINNLDRRVSRLESMIQDTKSATLSNNKFTESNYHMM